jgi:hypothetical protein
MWQTVQRELLGAYMGHATNGLYIFALSYLIVVVFEFFRYV